MEDSRGLLRERVGNYLTEYSALYHRPGSRDNSRAVLAEFAPFLAARAKRAPLLDDVDRESVTAFLLHKLGQGRAPATANRHLRTLKAFLRWCVVRGWIPKDPTLGIRPLKVLRRRPPIAERCQLRKLLAYLRRTSDRRYEAMILLVANTGLRLGEFLYLREEDVDLENRTLLVRNDETHRTKDNEERTIPLNARALEVLAPWVTMRRARGGEFCFFDVKPPRDVKTYSRGMQRRTTAADVQGVTWYSLRHLFATTLASKVPELVLAAYMGHSDPRTTRRWYIHRAHLAVSTPPVI